MIDKHLANEILDTALSTGATFAELFIENKTKNSIILSNGIVEKALAGIDYGIGLRLILGERVIYSYTNVFDKQALLKLAKESSAALSGSTISHPSQFQPKSYVSILPSSVNKTDIVEMLKSASSAALEYSPLITQTKMSYIDEVQDILIINSEGLWAEDRRLRTRSALTSIASNESEKQSGYLAPGSMSGFEFYNTINLDEIAKETARSAVTSLNADLCPSGKMPVIIDNGFGGVIFHEACGHALEASSVAKKASVFANKIGEKIASEKVTAIDDGTIEKSWGSINIDDEGNPAQKNILIENGILKSYLVDKYNGNKLNIPPTGSSRRESYKYMPTSRMTNTYIASGNDKAQDIISSTDYGIYAKYMGGGSVNPATGEFNFAVNEAYIVRNGKIAEPVRGATLIGKGYEVLNKIDMVSDNLALADGMCGASSGSVPVCVGQPMLRVSEITVGGRK